MCSLLSLFGGAGDCAGWWVGEFLLLDGVRWGGIESRILG